MSRDADDADAPIEQWPPAAPAAPAAPVAAIPPAPAPRGSWWGQVLRSLAFLPVDWRGLRAGPLTVALLIAAELALFVGIEWLYVDAPATLYWPSLLQGWFTTATFGWIAWALMRPARAVATPRPADGSTLFALVLGQSLAISALVHLGTYALNRAGQLDELRPIDGWLVAHASLLWCLSVQAALFWRVADRPLRAAAAWLLGAAAMIAQTSAPSSGFWAPDAPPEAAQPPGLELSQAALERQPRLLDEQLAALRPGRRGEVELYAIAFAPYGHEDVFKREAELVDTTMRERFDAQGRSVRLVNNPATVDALPWATPLNLERAIARAAAAMNRDEDILFLHLTSHGGRDGKLAAALWPLQVDEVTPQQLKAWLDAAGVRHRVISISACYSGSWIAPLADEHTLVMTAADAEHTSYGCGRLSELTFFGRAMYAEQLRETRSFEVAHAQAREVIAQREKEAGKDDGYSNPQISFGAGARVQLEKLVQRLDKLPAREAQAPAGPTDGERRWYALRNAVHAKDHAAAEKLLHETPALLRQTNSIGETVLHFLAVENDRDGVAWLKARGADLDTKNRFGTPVVFEVAQLEYKELFAWFAAQGADMRALDRDGQDLFAHLQASDRGEMAKWVRARLAAGKHDRRGS